MTERLEVAAMTENAAPVYDRTREGVRYVVYASGLAAIDARTRVANVRVEPLTAAPVHTRSVLVRVVKGRATASGGLPSSVIVEVAELIRKTKAPEIGPRVSFPLWTLQHSIAVKWTQRHDPKKRTKRREQIRELVDAIRILRTHAVP